MLKLWNVRNTRVVSRNPNIDFLRGIAITLVLLLHHALSYGFHGSIVAEILPKAWLHNLVINGNYGVTMFFSISSYLITSNTIQRYGNLSSVKIGQFYCLRAARILPPLLLALLIITALALAGLQDFRNVDGGHDLPDSYLFLAIFSVLTFWHNVLMQFQGYFNYALNIYWSLSVEEIFYLAFPLACTALKSERNLILMALLIIAIGPLYRWQHSNNDIDYLYGYLACFDAISFGVIAALLQNKVKPNQMAIWRIAAAIGLVVFYLSGIRENVVFGFTGIALCTAILLIHIPPKQAPFWSYLTSPVRWMGSCVPIV